MSARDLLGNERIESWKELLTDNNAVSPVIGVILMVAITVILAAVIGGFVMGLTDNVKEPAPSATISMDYDGTNLTMSHSGGDTLDGENVYVVYNDTSTVTEDSWDTFPNGSPTINAGSSITLDSSDFDSDEPVRVVWRSPNGDDSSTLAEWNA